MRKQRLVKTVSCSLKHSYQRAELSTIHNYRYIHESQMRKRETVEMFFFRIRTSPFAHRREPQRSYPLTFTVLNS